jgi:hypothetical protein
MSFGFSDKQSDAFIGQCMALMSICLFPCENISYLLALNVLLFSPLDLLLLLSNGNSGFKTTTMRLGADVIVFTQNQNNWYFSFAFILEDLFSNITHYYTRTGNFWFHFDLW